MIVCLTFDDAYTSHLEGAGPILKEAGFNATFFINAQLIDNQYPGVMDWDQVKELGQDFELGNHNWMHNMMPVMHPDNQRKQIEYVPKFLEQEMTSFCYPGYHYDIPLMARLRSMGYTHARGGCSRTTPFWDFQEGGEGSPYNVVFDNPFNIQCLGIFGTNYGYTEFERSLDLIGEHECGVFCFHQLEANYPCGVSLDNFKRCVDCLVDRNTTVVAMRDIPDHFHYRMGVDEVVEYQEKLRAARRMRQKRLNLQ